MVVHVARRMECHDPCATLREPNPVHCGIIREVGARWWGVRTCRFRRLSFLLSMAASSSAHLVLRGPRTGCEASVSRPQLQGRLASTSTPLREMEPSWLHCHVAGCGGERARRQRHSHQRHSHALVHSRRRRRCQAIACGCLRNWLHQVSLCGGCSTCCGCRCMLQALYSGKVMVSYMKS